MMSKQTGNLRYAANLRRKRPALLRRTTTLATVATLIVLLGLRAFRDRVDAQAVQFAGNHDHLHYRISQVLYRLAPNRLPGTLELVARRPEDARRSEGMQCRHISPGDWASHSRWNFPWPRFARMDRDRNLFQYDLFSNDYAWAASLIGHTQLSSNKPACDDSFPVSLDRYAIGDADGDGRPEAVLVWCTVDARGRRIARAVLLNLGPETHEVQWACDIVNSDRIRIRRDHPNWPVVGPTILVSIHSFAAREPNKSAAFDLRSESRLYEWKPVGNVGSLDPDFRLWSPPNGRSVEIPADRPIDEALRLTLPQLGPK